MHTLSLAAHIRPLPGPEPQSSHLSPARAPWGADTGSAPVSSQASSAQLCLNAAAPAAHSSLLPAAQPQSPRRSAVPAQWRAQVGSAPASLLPSPVHHPGTAAAAMMHPQSGVSIAQNASARQSSPLPPAEEVQVQSFAHPEDAESAGPGDAMQHGPAEQRSAALPPAEQMQPSMAHTGGIASTAGGVAVLPPGEVAVQCSLGLGSPGIGSTPAAHTIKGMCSLPAAMRTETASLQPSFGLAAAAANHSMASGGAVCLQSPPVVSLGSGGSPSIGSTPAADTIKALEAAADASASQNGKGLQASPGLGSAGRPLAVGSTPAWNTIKALQRGHSSSKSVSILASGCSETAEAFAPNAPGEAESTCRTPLKDVAKQGHGPCAKSQARWQGGSSSMSCRGML